jgi:predicted Zn-dependent protease
MCQLCHAKSSMWSRRGFLLAAGAAAAGPALAQVDVGNASRARGLVPAQELEVAAAQQYTALLEQARAKGALAGESHPQLQRLRGIAQRLIPQSARWNSRASQWRWEVNLIGSNSVNAFCMPGGKIAFMSGLLNKLQISDDEAAMVMGHEMAHALREHARARIAKTQITGTVASIAAQVLGLGGIGDLAANVGTQLLSLKYSRDDENEADLVGLELAARAGYKPEASVSLWDKMAKAAGGGGGPGFLSSHPTGPDRMRNLEKNIPRVRGLYEQAVARR